MTEDSEPGLAATKVQPPVPPRHVVHRSRLDAALDAAVDQQVPLVLVSAPAGSGKSTLLGLWMAARSEAVAWLQVEELDSDPARFWAYLVQAIGRTQPELAAQLRPVVAGSSGDQDTVVPALVNRLTELSEGLVLVIDDYHLVEDERIHRGVERLVDLCPSKVTVVLATRMDPPFRLGRLRVRGRVAEIRADDLRFAPEEAAGLLGDTGAALDPELLIELCARTEGWAAGLVLAGLSLRASDDPEAFVVAFRGDDQLVVEYLRDELLADLDADEHRRLLETSILDELNGELVDAVTDTSGNGEGLRETARANQLLVPLDRTGTWFRYHHLLRDLPHLEAQATMPEYLPELHRRAAGWFEAAGDHGRAIGHRLAAGDLDGAARLMRVHGPRLLRAGQIDTLRALLDRLGEVARRDLACAFLAGWCASLTGRYTDAERWLDVMAAVSPPRRQHGGHVAAHQPLPRHRRRGTGARGGEGRAGRRTAGGEPARADHGHRRRPRLGRRRRRGTVVARHGSGPNRGGGQPFSAHRLPRLPLHRRTRAGIPRRRPPSRPHGHRQRRAVRVVPVPRRRPRLRRTGLRRREPGTGSRRRRIRVGHRPPVVDAARPRLRPRGVRRHLARPRRPGGRSPPRGGPLGPRRMRRPRRRRPPPRPGRVSARHHYDRAGPGGRPRRAAHRSRARRVALPSRRAEPARHRPGAVRLHEHGSHPLPRHLPQARRRRPPRRRPGGPRPPPHLTPHRRARASPPGGAERGQPEQATTGHPTLGMSAGVGVQRRIKA